MVSRMATLGLAVLAPALALGAEKDPRQTSVENGLLRSIVPVADLGRTESLEARMAEENVPGMSVAVIDDGRIAWASGYGVVRAGTDQPVTPETLFLAGSISKPVAATGALLLVQRGKLDLDEDVNEKLVSWKVPQPTRRTERR